MQYAKLHVVIESAGGEVILCNSDITRSVSDAKLLADTACIMWADISQDSDPATRSWFQRIQQLLARYVTLLYVLKKNRMKHQQQRQISVFYNHKAVGSGHD